MREVDVYKEKKKHWEKYQDTSIKKREAQERRRERKESEQCNYLYKLSLLRRACRGRDTLLFSKINLVFSILILKQSPLLLFVPLSYKF